MIGRVILAALLAGIAAGLAMGIIQHVRLTPLILEAEKYEMANMGHDHGAAEPPADGQTVANDAGVNHAAMHDAVAAESAGSTTSWRTEQTFAATAVAGAGFAAVLCGVSFLTGIPINRQNGLLWGFAGFATFSLAPAAGLPPELPGVPAADLMARQTWWLATVICTGAGLWLLSQRARAWAIIAGVAIILLPHLIGAPEPLNHDSALPADLLGRFVASSLASNGLFWILIGTFLGIALPPFEKSQET